VPHHDASNSCRRPLGRVHGLPGLLGGMEWTDPLQPLQTCTWPLDGRYVHQVRQPPQFVQNSHYYGGAVTPDPTRSSTRLVQAFDATQGRCAGAAGGRSAGAAFTGDLRRTSCVKGDLTKTFSRRQQATGRDAVPSLREGPSGRVVIATESGEQYVATTSGVGSVSLRPELRR